MPRRPESQAWNGLSDLAALQQLELQGGQDAHAVLSAQRHHRRGLYLPLIIPPQQVYTPYLFPDFTGLSAAYQFNLGDFDIEAEAYWGNFEGAVTFQDESPVDVKVDNIRGLILDM